MEKCFELCKLENIYIIKSNNNELLAITNNQVSLLNIFNIFFRHDLEENVDSFEIALINKVNDKDSILVFEVIKDILNKVSNVINDFLKMKLTSQI